MDKKDLSRLVAEYIAKGGVVKSLPAGEAQGSDEIAKWAVDRKVRVIPAYA